MMTANTIYSNFSQPLTNCCHSLLSYRFSFSVWKNLQMAVEVKQLWLKTANSSPNWTPKLCGSLKINKCGTSDACHTNPIQST